MGQCNLLHALRLALTRIRCSACMFCTCAEMRERYKRARRAPVYDRDERRPAFSQSPPDDASAQRGNRGGSTGPGGGLGMSRLDAVVRVLKATGKALHYDIITRQALQQGIIRFTGSQGTAGESMKVCCHPPAYKIGRAPLPCSLLTMARTRSCALSCHSPEVARVCVNN